MADVNHSENRATIWMYSELLEDVVDTVDWKNSSRLKWNTQEQERDSPDKS